MSKMPIMLIPPSEGKTEGGVRRVARDRFAPELGLFRKRVLCVLAEQLEVLTKAELAGLLRVRGALLERAIVATRSVIDGDAPVMSAWRRYNGVVWDHLDPGTLPATVRARLFVPSALYGMTSAEDSIADYRLTMHVSLVGIGNLARFWRDPLTRPLRDLRGHPPIVNLLPAEHTRAFHLSQIPNVIDVRFLRADGQGAAGHRAKAAKGRFARHLIDHGLDAAAAFCFEGWKVEQSSAGFDLCAPG